MRWILPLIPLVTNRDFIFFVLVYHYILAEILFPRCAFISLGVMLFFLKSPKEISMVIRAYYKLIGAAFSLMTLYLWKISFKEIINRQREFTSFWVETNIYEIIQFIIYQLIIAVLMIWNCYLLIEMRFAYLEEKTYISYR